MATKQVKREVVETVGICDICGTEDSPVVFGECPICEREFCTKCSSGEESLEFNFGSDEWCCKKCWAAGKPHRKLIAQAVESWATEANKALGKKPPKKGSLLWWKES